MEEMKYSRKAWFVNRFDVLIATLIGPTFVFALISSSAFDSGFAKYVWIVLLSFLVINFVLTFVVVHKAWGWMWLPVFLLVRFFATLAASFCALFVVAGMAYKDAANTKFSKAWTQDSRSRNYREGVRDSKTSEAFQSAGSGVWGFLVSHTLEFCEK